MPKYAVSLGVIDRTVVLEATSAQQALDNVLVTKEPHSIAMIPREDKKDSWWLSRNTSDGKDEVLVKSTDQARKMLGRLRTDVLDVFWFVSLEEERNDLGSRKLKKVK